MKRLKIFLFGISAFIVMLLLFVYFAVAKSSVVKAQIHVEGGTVFVNGNPITKDQELSQGDIIETGAESTASVIIYESVIVGLEENTKISLEDLTRKHPKLSQESGATWNKFTKLLGVEEYSISTGNTVASVRGTMFGFKRDRLITAEGVVRYTIGESEIDIMEEEVGEFVNGAINKRKITSSEEQEIEKNRDLTIKRLKVLRQKEIDKHSRLLRIIKSKFGLTDEDIKKGLEAADDGRMDIEEITRKSPVETQGVKKIADITKEIQGLRGKSKGKN